MILPSNVPTRGTLGLVQFDVLDAPYVTAPPAAAKLRAWKKFAETERRWLYFEWFAKGVAREAVGCRVLMDDAAAAFLMSFEAAIQVAGAQLFPGRNGGQKLNTWLKGLPADVYDLTCRGLRTMRHIEAHVRAGSLERLHGQLAGSIFAAGGEAALGLPWCFPSLRHGDLPPRPALYNDELPAWNQLVEDNLAAEIMRLGKRRLYAILKAAEA